MKCVILAAGRGKRLRPLTNKTPKCLLTVGGIPLLARTLQNLTANGINDIAVVTGFMGEKIGAFVSKNFSSTRVTLIHNTRFASTNNAFSLLQARPFVGEGPMLLLDGDIFFGKELLTHFLKARRKPNRAAVRVRGTHNDEEIKVRINRWDHVLEIGKHVPLQEAYGESIGIELFSGEATGHLFRILASRMKQREHRTEFYEASFQQFIDEGNRLWADDIGSYPVVEIDTPSDLAAAERMNLAGTSHA